MQELYQSLEWANSETLAGRLYALEEFSKLFYHVVYSLIIYSWIDAYKERVVHYKIRICKFSDNSMLNILVGRLSQYVPSKQHSCLYLILFQEVYNIFSRKSCIWSNCY